MPFDLSKLLDDRHGENFELHECYLNPKLTKVVTTLGFDRFYVRGEGCYLYDDQGMRYLDLLSGFGVFALGRSHPVVKAALRQALDADLPNMVQLTARSCPDCWPSSWSPAAPRRSNGPSSATPAPRPSRRQSSSPGPAPSATASSITRTPTTDSRRAPWR